MVCCVNCPQALTAALKLMHINQQQGSSDERKNKIKNVLYTPQSNQYQGYPPPRKQQTGNSLEDDM
jgi:hypothetical protein